MRKNPRRILSSTRTENKGLTAIAIIYHELRQLARSQAVTSDSVTATRTRSGMLVGTKLGTVELWRRSSGARS
jgi:hypothetical protein